MTNLTNVNIEAIVGQIGQASDMVKTVNIYEAKTSLSRLVEEASAGEEIIIAKAGKPKARLISAKELLEPRTPGGWAGRVRIAEDFDEALPDDLLTLFEGRDESSVD